MTGRENASVVRIIGSPERKQVQTHRSRRLDRGAFVILRFPACENGGMKHLAERQLGSLGPRVSALGLGCMSIGIADVYTSSVRSEEAAVALIRHALDLGITLLDTADIYGVSELQVGHAIKNRREDVIVATKFGFLPTKTGEEQAVSGRPDYVRNACDTSLQRLQTDYIDLYYQHRVDKS